MAVSARITPSYQVPPVTEEDTRFLRQDGLPRRPRVRGFGEFCARGSVPLASIALFSRACCNLRIAKSTCSALSRLGTPIRCESHAFQAAYPTPRAEEFLSAGLVRSDCNQDSRIAWEILSAPNRTSVQVENGLQPETATLNASDSKSRRRRDNRVHARRRPFRGCEVH